MPTGEKRWAPGLVALAVGMMWGCGPAARAPLHIVADAEAALADLRYEDAVALIPGERELTAMAMPAELRARLRLLRGEALVMRRDRREGLALLENPIAGLDAEGDRRRRTVLALQKCRGAASAEELRRGLAMLDGVLRETAPGSAEAAVVQLRRVACLELVSDAGGAEAALREALGLARKSGSALLEAQTLNELGRLSVIQERYDAGVAYLQQAIRVSDRGGVRGRHTRRLATGNLGWCQLEMGDYERALLTIRNFEARTNRERVVTWANEAQALMALRDLEGAEGLFRKGLEVALRDQTVGGLRQAGLMQGLADLNMERGEWEEAERWSGRALELLRSLRQPGYEQIEELRGARIALGKGSAKEAEARLRRLLAGGTEMAMVSYGARMELGRALAAQGRNGEAEEAFGAAMREVEEARGTLREAENRMAFGAGRMDVYRAAVRFYLETKRPDAALRVADRSRARGLREETGRRRAEGTVLFYWLDEPASHLWVVPAAGGAAHFALPGAGELERLVEAHNQFVQRARDPLTEGGREARRLYAALIGPAEKMLPGGRVWISPDGGLHALNFETLVAPGRERYWVEDAEISIVPGLTGPVRTGGEGKGVLLAGDAVAGAAAGFGELRHAGEELARIGARLGTAALRREAATPERVLAGLKGDPAVVHFAAHAVANRLRPLESSILLSPGAAGEGRLYAREIAGLQLRAKLVTLSACTAAGARQFRGEGLVGFAWAFLGAGAEGVVASLWEVDDASTPRLMEEMYGRLGAGRSAAASLREAKLALLRSGSALRKPYFWAAFQHFAR